MAAPSATDPLPPLRQDIALCSLGRLPDGSPHWVLHDPATDGFLAVGWPEMEIIARWHHGSEAAVLAAVGRETTLAVGAPQVKSVRDFLAAHGLLRQDAATLRARQARSAAGGLLSRVGRLLGQSLFRRVPLFRPQTLLERTLPVVQPLFGRTFWLMMGVCALVGAYLAARQWQALAGGLTEFYSLEGAVGIAVALTVAKACHELAHAYSAVRNGASVTSMGVTLILLWPVLYTEASSAWLLADRRKRIEIAAAGLLAELALAILALLAWGVMQSGPARNTMLFAATTLIALSVIVNANPLMRFDGYYVLCELTGLDNLQARSLALVRWALRRLATGLPLECPELQLGGSRQWLIGLYGVAVVLYRVVFYGGIALTLHAIVFPALGVPLAVMVVTTFVVAPAVAELVQWLQLSVTRGGRWLGPLRPLAVLAVVLLPLVVPWRGSVGFPVVMHGGEALTLFAPEPARIGAIAVRDGAEVRAGELLIRLDSPDLDGVELQAAERVSGLDLAVRQHLTDRVQQSGHGVRERQLSQARAEVDSYRTRRRRLGLVAPIAGIATSLDPGLAEGVWVAPEQPLVQIVAPGGRHVVGYVEERDLAALRLGAEGSLWLEGRPERAIAVRIGAVHTEALPVLDAPMLAAPRGGPIAVRAGPDGVFVPETAIYKVMLVLDPAGPDLPLVAIRGYADIEAEPRSLLGRLIERLAAVWRRELG